VLGADCPCQCGVGKEAALKKYVVRLAAEERESLVALTRKGKASARRIKRASIVLAADAGDKDELIAEKVSVHRVTVDFKVRSGPTRKMVGKREQCQVRRGPVEKLPATIRRRTGARESQSKFGSGGQYVGVRRQTSENVRC
jgi:hypothetical protein